MSNYFKLHDKIYKEHDPDVSVYYAIHSVVQPPPLPIKYIAVVVCDETLYSEITEFEKTVHDWLRINAVPEQYSLVDERHLRYMVEKLNPDNYAIHYGGLIVYDSELALAFSLKFNIDPVHYK